MCGIAGVIGLRDGLAAPEPAMLARMCGALTHRGPDEFGIYHDERAGFAHARLSIIDLATGQQPLANETGRLWVVFNGEIFNYLELRDELVAHGHQFRTRSDTEVIVHAYEQWGDQAFARFNGQWAIALWDRDAETLVLARDPYGVRPLYYCEHGGRLWFASEVKAIFAADPTVPRALDPIGLDQLFTFWAPIAPRTVFAGVQEIEPAMVRTIRRSGEVSTSWAWRPSYPSSGAAAFTGTMADAAVAVREALEKATALRMLRADVPVGSYLSGGLDSSLVAALGLRAKGTNFATFSLRFEDAEYDETHYQRLMASRLGSEHHEIVVTGQDIVDAFPAVVAHAERPMLRTAPAPLFLLSGLVRDHGIKVVLTGEGADEMFAGYDVFREARVRRFWARQPGSTWRPALLDRLYPYLSRSPVAQRALSRQFFGQNLAQWQQPGFGHDMRWRSTAAIKRLFAPDVRAALTGVDARQILLDALPPEFAAWPFLCQDQYLEIRTLLSGYLLPSQGDRMLMAHSVEGRFPFLDREVCALADSLPPAYKLSGLDEKHVVKLASKDLVPEEVLTRKKQPYRAPDAMAFANATRRDWIEEAASEAALRDAGVFEPAQARALLAKCLRGGRGQFSNTDNMAFIGLVSTQLVHQQFVARRPEARPVTLRTHVDARTVSRSEQAG